MDLRSLKTWEQALTSEIDSLKKRRKELDSEIEQRTKKLELVREMLSLEGGASHSQQATEKSKEPRATAVTVREAAANILSEAGRPLHITEIHQQFIDKGYAIPGAGTPFNILVHMLKDDSVVRVARGTYALRSSVGPGDFSEARKPRRRKRRRSRKPKE